MLERAAGGEQHGREVMALREVGNAFCVKTIDAGGVHLELVRMLHGANAMSPVEVTQGKRL